MIAPVTSFAPAFAPARISRIGGGTEAECFWPELVDKIIEHGQFTPGDGEIPDTMGLADIRGNTDGPHQADYINLWGGVDQNDEFQPMFATLVSENWQIGSDGNWHIDQWLHRLGADGEPWETTHVVLVEDPDGRVIEYRPESLPVTDPRAEQNRLALLTEWRAFPV